MNVTDIVLLLGGVAMFLFGMAFMGEGLKKVAGDKLELILYKLSGTPLKGIFLGTGVTAIIQSSSATSVMVVGFVNAEMMKVKQAISVIMGAIIGTSITGWIICLSSFGGSSGVLGLLSTESISAVAAIVGILLRMCAKKKQYKAVGDILLGFGVLMFGMKTMSGSVSGLRDDPRFVAFLTTFRNPVFGIILGLIFTAVLQSASATVGILQALSSTGIITFEIALPIILGIAIGASVPVILSAVGSTTDGKRAAYSYLVIEIIRVILFSAVFYGLNAFLHFSFLGKTMNMVDIALLNTVFRASTILVLVPFINQIEKLLNRLIKRTPEELQEYNEINRLEPGFLAYPTLAVEQCRLSMSAMSSLTLKSIVLARELLDEYSDSKVYEVEKLENTVDRYEDKIGNYLMRLTGSEMNETQNAAVTEYLHMLSDFERISDHARDLAHAVQELHEKKLSFSAAGGREIQVLANAISENVTAAVTGFQQNDLELAFHCGPLEEIVKRICEEIKQNHIERLKRGESRLVHSYVLNDMLNGYERIAAHCSNISLTTIEIHDNTIAHHEYEKGIKEKKSKEYTELMDFYTEKYLREM